MAEGEPRLPIDPAVAEAPSDDGRITTVSRFTFPHAFARFEPDRVDDHSSAGSYLQRLYLELLDVVGLPPIPAFDGKRQRGPYNLLITRAWMLMVPRGREHFGRMSVNSLGFAGSLLVRGKAGLEEIRRVGPMDVLAAVGRSTVSET